MKNGFLIKKQLEEGVSFDLLAADGLLLCRSRAFRSDADCLAGLEQLRSCDRYELYPTTAGGYSFRLLDADNAVLAQGPDFAAEYSCRRGVQLALAYAPTAEIVVPTQDGDSAAGQRMGV